MRPNATNEKSRGRALEALDRIGSQLTVMSTREAVIEGKIGILEYGSERIRISTGRGSVAFCGVGLRLRCFNREFAVVTGKLNCIEFFGGCNA